jgi:hypothetical protein
MDATFFVRTIALVVPERWTAAGNRACGGKLRQYRRTSSVISPGVKYAEGVARDPDLHTFGP